MAWFRVYDDLLDDPKVQALPPALFKGLVNLWCVTKRCNGVLPPPADLSFRLRMSEAAVVAMLGKLREAGLIDTRADGLLVPHNWESRQFVSDNVSERVRKHREKRHGAVPRNGDETFHGTPPETEQKQSRTDETPNGVSPAQPAHAEQVDGRKPKRKTRIPADWRPSAGGVEFAGRHGFGPAETERIGQRFRDHWLGKGECRADWDASFRTWIGNEVEFGRGRAGAAKPDPAEQQQRDRAAILAAVAPEIPLRG